MIWLRFRAWIRGGELEKNDYCVVQQFSFSSPKLRGNREDNGLLKRTQDTDINNSNSINNHLLFELLFPDNLGTHSTMMT
jgi:hypothetical protein